MNLFPEKSRTCGDKGTAGFQMYYIQITAYGKKNQGGQRKGMDTRKGLRGLGKMTRFLQDQG